MIFAAAEPKSFMETYLPYMVLATGLLAAVLFLSYFMASTDKRKRITGSFLAILLAGFSVFCITEGEGVRRAIAAQDCPFVQHCCWRDAMTSRRKPMQRPTAARWQPTVWHSSSALIPRRAEW